MDGNRQVEEHVGSCIKYIFELASSASIYNMQEKKHAHFSID